MKAHLYLFSSCLLLCSCAATGPASSSGDSEANQLTLEERLYDTEFMGRYEGLARRGGAKVYWINKPRRDRDEN